MSIDQTVAVSAKPGGFMESQSGIQRRNPKIFCRLVGSGDKKADLFVLVHPTSNFHNHYLVEPLVKRRATVLLVNTRYVANDSMLLMERAIQDLGAAIQMARSQGFESITLIGNSGGGSLAAFYQEQAEKLTITSTPDGRPFDIGAADLPAVERIALTCAHPGRAEQLLSKIDPSMPSEERPDAVNSQWDMFDPRNGPSYQDDWLAGYRLKQKERIEGIEHWVLGRLRELEASRPVVAADEAFVVHRTQADPRLLDLGLDPNDRKVGSIQGDARHANMAANGLARFCTLRSFLSQWSPTHSRANGPRCLANTSVPVLIVDHTADQTVFPSHIASWKASAGERASLHRLVGAPHYADDKPELVAELAGVLVDWSRSGVVRQAEEV